MIHIKRAFDELSRHFWDCEGVPASCERCMAKITMDVMIKREREKDGLIKKHENN